MEGPEEFLEGLGLTLPSLPGTGAKPVLRAELRTTVNGHFFWVADGAELARLRAAPHAFTGPLLDPTQHEWFQPTARSPRLDIDDEILLFASADSLQRFEASRAGPPRHAH